jgi:hypothetical protein
VTEAPEVRSGSGVLEPTAVESGQGPHSRVSRPALDPPREGRTGRGEAFDGCVEDIRRRYISNSVDVAYALEDGARRRLGLAPTSAGAMVLFPL